MSVVERTGYECIECGAQHSKWAGQCATCAAWNTIVEVVAAAPARVATEQRPPARLGDVDPLEASPRPTGIGELDRVLGGGLVPGSVTLLGGEPGIGKSTLVMQVAAGWRGPVLYVSGEESAQQVSQRAIRLTTGAAGPGSNSAPLEHVWVAAETELRGIVADIDRVEPELVVVDSIQTVADETLAPSPGSPTQVRECARRFVVEAKRRHLPVVLVGHVTKEGALAGPRALEHVVDTVLSFEGERHHALRLVRAVKHRFGSTHELGLFEMTDAGLAGVPDPSTLFLGDRRDGVAGSVVVPAMEGKRPLLVEVQALTVPIPQGATARRTAQGLDANRLAMLLAVIDRRLHVPALAADVYASTVGGVRLVEPGVDAGVALAVVSAITDRPARPDVVAIGEVGLAGEIRQVAHTARRLAEAARLGYRRAIVPPGSPTVDGVEPIVVDTLQRAVGHALVPTP